MINAIKKQRHVSLILYGPRGAGKSRTALIIAYSILYYQKYKKLPQTKEEFEDFDLWSRVVHRQVIYNPEQLIRKIKNRKTRIPVLIIDDANIMFNSRIYRENAKLYFALIGLFATIRTEVANLIITAVDPEELIKPLRQMQAWFGKVYTKNNVVNVLVQELIQTPLKPYLRTVGRFSWKNDILPDRAYRDYLLFRKALSKKAIEFVERALHKDDN